MFPNQQPQQYPPQQPPGYYPQQPQGYYPPATPPAAPPQQQPAQVGTLDGFFNAPSSGGGPALKFKDKQIGTSYSFIVARKVTNGDVRQQTDPSGRPLTYRDGRPKFVMVVPVLIQHPEYPEGRATWWVKGQVRDELVRAMSAAGAPEGPPEEGAAIQVTLTGQRPIPGLNPQYLYEVRYVRPDNAQGERELTGVAASQQPAGGPAAMAQQHGHPVHAQTPAQPAPQQPAPSQPQQPPAQPAPQAPEGLSAEQAALLARLTGGS